MDSTSDVQLNLLISMPISYQIRRHWHELIYVLFFFENCVDLSGLAIENACSVVLWALSKISNEFRKIDIYRAVEKTINSITELVIFHFLCPALIDQKHIVLAVHLSVCPFVCPQKHLHWPYLFICNS